MANGNNYTLPIGIDAKDFFADLANMDKGLERLEGAGAEMSKGLSGAFEKVVASGQKMEDKLAGATDKIKLLRDAAKAVGRDLGDAFSTKDVEAQVAKFQELFKRLGKNGKVDMGITFNQATIKELQNGLKGISGEMNHFKNLVAAAKVQLASLDPGSSDFESLSEQIAITEGFMEGLAEAETEVATNSKSLRAQLREMKQELSLMEEAGQDGTARFEELSIAAGKLEDQLGDTAQRVRVLASDTKYIDAAIQGVTGLVGAMTAAQGASALFGEDNEELTRSIQKVTAAMAILQGIQAVAATLNKDSAFSILFLSKARAADAVAATAEAAATTAEATAAEGAAVATNSLTAALLKNPITLVVVGILAAVTALYAFMKSNDDTAQSVERLNRALEDENKILDLNLQGIKARTDYEAAVAGIRKNSQEEVIRIQGRGLQSELKAIDETNAVLQQKVNAVTGYSKEEVETREKYNKQIQDNIARHNEVVNQINIKGIDLQKQRLEDQKAIRDEILQFTKELASTRLSAAEDQTIRQKATVARAQAKTDADARIADLNKEVLRSAEAEKLRAQLILAIRAEQRKKIRDIDRQEAKDLTDQQKAGTLLLLDFAKENQDNRTAIHQNEMNQLAVEEQDKLRMIYDSFKDNKRLQDDLIGALEKYIADKRRNLKLKYAQESQKLQEQIEAASINVLYGFKDLPARVEEAKQFDLLRIQLKGAQERLRILKEAGKAETDAQVILALEEIARIEGTIDSKIREGKRTRNIFDLFGLEGAGGLTPEQEKGIQEGAAAMITAYKQVTDFMLAENQRQAQSSTDRIQAFQTDIDKLQDQLSREEDLRRKGYANNAEQAKKDLEEKKRLQKEEIDNRKKLFEEQKAIQRQQLIVDTIAQASSLVTASANVIEGFSTIPVIGPVLGLAAVGLMIAGFISSKVSAFNAVNNQKETFAEGGTIDGEPHSRGGKKYRAMDGSGDVVELEGGEEVTRKTQAAKFRPLLKAINDDSISSMSDEALAKLLQGSGVHFETDLPEQGNAAHQEFQAAKSTFIVATSGGPDPGDLKAIREDVNYLADRKRESLETWEDQDFFYTRTGNVTTKERKT